MEFVVEDNTIFAPFINHDNSDCELQLTRVFESNVVIEVPKPESHDDDKIVEPSRKVLCKIECDYSGKTERDGTILGEINIPGEWSSGIFYSEDYRQRAHSDMLTWCMTHQIYPSRNLKEFLKSKGFSDKLNVMRSSGEINDDFEIDDNDSFCFGAPVLATLSNTDGKLCIKVVNKLFHISKYVQSELKEYCL